ncbi:MAG: glycosyltransferase family 39 protein [Anaerolineae bacterium]
MTNPEDSAIRWSCWRQRARNWAPVLALTLLAAVLRLVLLTDLPPGLYHDEAFNGLDALGVLKGKHSVYFAANQGREPFFIYLVAATVGLLGRTPGALRLAAVVCGTLTVPATYAMVQAWFNRRTALLSSFILATTVWHIHLSRVGFRAVTLPLAMALTLSVGAWAFRSRRRAAWLLTGLVYGAAFYTYLPARSTPVVLMAFGVYLVWAGQGGRLWPAILYLALGALVALIPLGAYTVSHWDVVMGRLGRVSVFNPVINQGDLWGTLGRQLLRVLGMFFVRGDISPRHNLPGRPVFDVVMAAAMILGTLNALIRARRREVASALTVIYVGLMLLPTWLADDAPHFLRAAGVLPPLVILPALGLEAAGSWLERRGWRFGSTFILGSVLAISLASAGWDYFVRYRNHPALPYVFEDAAAHLAAEVNGFLGTGWDGDGIVAASCSPRKEQRVYLDRRLLDEWASLSFLIVGAEGVTPFRADAPPSPSGPALIIVWPHSGLERYVDALPRNTRITARAGPLTMGDLEEVPYIAYVSYVVEPGAKPAPGYIARFGDMISLTDYAVERHKETWEVGLEWSASSPPPHNYTVSVRLLDGEQVVAQHDAEPCDGTYPTSLWREGDIVVDEHILELPQHGLRGVSLTVGLYDWPAMERLEARDSDGNRLGTQVKLPVAERLQD